MPLATAAFLNKGVRAVALLAKAFLNLKHWELAKFAALNAIDREPNNKIANGVLVELQKTGNL